MYMGLGSKPRPPFLTFPTRAVSKERLKKREKALNSGNMEESLFSSSSSLLGKTLKGKKNAFPSFHHPFLHPFFSPSSFLSEFSLALFYIRGGEVKNALFSFP